MRNDQMKFVVLQGAYECLIMDVTYNLFISVSK